MTNQVERMIVDALLLCGLSMERAVDELVVIHHLLDSCWLMSGDVVVYSLPIGDTETMSIEFAL